MIDYELQAAKARQRALREASGWREPVSLVTEIGPKVRLTKEQRAAERAAERAAKQAEQDKLLWLIAQKIMGRVGDCIPDGDPIDLLAPYVRRVTGCKDWDVTKWLNKACRKHLDCKSYGRYLIDMWDSWNEVCEPDQRMDNPWRPSK